MLGICSFIQSLENSHCSYTTCIQNSKNMVFWTKILSDRYLPLPRNNCRTRSLWWADSHSQMSVDSLCFTLRLSAHLGSPVLAGQKESCGHHRACHRMQLLCAGGLFNRRNTSPPQPGRRRSHHGMVVIGRLLQLVRKSTLMAQKWASVTHSAGSNALFL